MILQRFGSELPSYGDFALPWLNLDSTCRILVRNSDRVSFGGVFLLFQLMSYASPSAVTPPPLRSKQLQESAQNGARFGQDHREGRRSQHCREFRSEEAKSSVKRWDRCAACIEDISWWAHFRGRRTYQGVIFGLKLIQDLLHHAISPLLATPEEVHEKVLDRLIAVTLHSNVERLSNHCLIFGGRNFPLASGAKTPE